MKEYKKSYYQAHFPNNGGRLDYHGVNLKDMQREIDDRNSRMIERHYKPDQFIITFVEWRRIFDDNGIFHEETSVEKFVELYPETLERTRSYDNKQN